MEEIEEEIQGQEIEAPNLTSTHLQPEDDQTLDPERQEKAKEYARIGRWFFVIDLVFNATYIILWVVMGLSGWWRDIIVQNITTSTWLGIIIFAFGFGLPYALIDTPLGYYTGFVLPHRYGQSNQTFKAWLIDQLKAGLLGGILGVIVLEVIYFLLGVAPQTWWLWTTGVMLIFTVVLGTLAPVLIFPLFFKVQPLEDEELIERLTQLAHQANTKVEGVYTFDMSSKTVAANAALMGLGNTRRIILGDTLLDNFTTAEIETVLAHELGHHVHKDMGWGIVVQTGITIFGFWLADVVMRWGIAFYNYQGLTDLAAFPLLLLALSIFGIVTMPLGNIWSRWREVMADTYALETTKNPQAFINAMTRLANQNLAEAEPPAWIEFLLHSHPSIHRRVARAKQFEATLK